jgi:hypothetical protein
MSVIFFMFLFYLFFSFSFQYVSKIWICQNPELWCVINWFNSIIFITSRYTGSVQLLLILNMHILSIQFGWNFRFESRETFVARINSSASSHTRLLGLRNNHKLTEGSSSLDRSSSWLFRHANFSQEVNLEKAACQKTLFKAYTTRHR